jgi:hypothetical protein
MVLSLAVNDKYDVDAVLAAYHRQELAAFSNIQVKPQHGIVILKNPNQKKYIDYHPWSKCLNFLHVPLLILDKI